jgi:hypothetical protein
MEMTGWLAANGKMRLNGSMKTSDHPIIPASTKATLDRMLEDLATDIAVSVFEGHRDEWEANPNKVIRVPDVQVFTVLKIHEGSSNELLLDASQVGLGKHTFPRLAPKDYSQPGLFGREAMKICRSALENFTHRKTATVTLSIIIKEKTKPSRSTSYVTTANFNGEGKLLLRFSRTSPRRIFGKPLPQQPGHISAA